MVRAPEDRTAEIKGWKKMKYTYGIVTMRDVRAAKQCSKGVRRFCLDHSIDWNDFLKNGISVSILEKIDDAIIQDIVKAHKERTNGR